MINISKELNSVWDFQEAFGHSQTTSLNIGLQKDRKLRLDLQLEELGELHKALYENNHTETLDAIIDGLYICFGSVHYHGLLNFASYMEGEEMIDLELTQYPIEINLVLNQIKSRYLFGNITYSELLNAFCSIANLLLSMLDKLVKLEIVNDDLPGQFLEVHQNNMSKLDKDGKPIFRKDGKILKGENYYKPNLKQFLK